MKENDFRLPAQDGTPLFVRAFLPAQKPRAIVQIAHGLAEHSARYARLAHALTDHGFGVYANDHRGHGYTAQRPEDLGFFAERNGWTKVVGDQRTLLQEVNSRHPDTPVFLLGHSMGSYIARGFALRHGKELAGLLLSGTTHAGLWSFLQVQLLAKLERLRVGKRGRSRIVKSFTIDPLNLRFRNPRTDVDWLSRDEAEVDKYVADPLCGFDVTNQMWHDVMGGLMEICSEANIARMPKDLPIYIFAGERDPLNDRLSAIRAFHMALDRAGMKSVTLRAYQGARHELFNETNRDEVTHDVIEWLEQQLSC